MASDAVDIILEASLNSLKPEAISPDAWSLIREECYGQAAHQAGIARELRDSNDGMAAGAVVGVIGSAALAVGAGGLTAPANIAMTPVIAGFAAGAGGIIGGAYYGLIDAGTFNKDTFAADAKACVGNKLLEIGAESH